MKHYRGQIKQHYKALSFLFNFRPAELEDEANRSQTGQCNVITVMGAVVKSGTMKSEQWIDFDLQVELAIIGGFPARLMSGRKWSKLQQKVCEKKYRWRSQSEAEPVCSTICEEYPGMSTVAPNIIRMAAALQQRVFHTEAHSK